MKKENSFEIVTRTNAKGRTYTNLIFSDYSLSANYKIKNEIIKFNKNTRESTAKKSKMLYKIIKNINFFKQLWQKEPQGSFLLKNKIFL